MLMTESDTLYALAEVSIAIAGFSAIVVLFKRGESGSWVAGDADRFNGMLLHSMAAATFCVLPSIIVVFVANEAIVWSIASTVLGAQIVGHSVVIFRLRSTDSLGRASLGIAAIVVGLQVLNVFSVHFSREFGPYLVGVLWHLLHAGGLFVSLVWVRSSDRPDS